jgi:hypothetical protein
LPPCGLSCPWETFKNIKTKKLINFNSLTKVTKLIPTFINAKLYYASKFTNLEPNFGVVFQLSSIVEDVYFVGIQKCVP